MGYIEKRQQLDDLKKEIESLGELSAEVKKKINYKFRLDWNYYSNSMEGNTLTRAETRSIMIDNINVHDRPLKDLLEVRGHDRIISEILQIGKGGVRISEKRIKEIHEAIMHEDTPQKKKLIGQWKTENNEIINYKKEKFEFVQPNEVPDKMHNLLNRTNAAIDSVLNGSKNAPHPIDIALQFHLDYLTIHPFYDGNGRTSRILTNLILISFGYPPFWISEKEKEIYYKYLADVQSYGGNAELLNEFMVGLVHRSQNLVLDAMAGKDIDEDQDLDKKIALLERELEAINPDEEVKIRFSSDYFHTVLHSWLKDLMVHLIPKIQKFNKFFTESRHHINMNMIASGLTFADEPVEKILSDVYRQEETNRSNFNTYDASFYFDANYGSLKKGGLRAFGCNYSMEIKFNDIKYEVYVDEFTESNLRKHSLLFERLLHKNLTEEDIKSISTKLTNAIFEHIDFNSRKQGLR